MTMIRLNTFSDALLHIFVKKNEKIISLGTAGFLLGGFFRV